MLQALQNIPLETSIKCKTRGKTMYRERWEMDPENRINLELNEENQLIGESAKKLSSAGGVIARMGNLCPITYNDWRILKKDLKERIMSYVKERFNVTSEIEEKCVLQTIGHLWNSHKTALRKAIHEAVQNNIPTSEIHDNVPVGLPEAQWIQFVNYWLTKDAIEISKKKKAIRAKQQVSHTTGSKSFARYQHELELSRKRKIGPIEFFLETHQMKNGQMKDDASGVWINYLSYSVL